MPDAARPIAPSRADNLLPLDVRALEFGTGRDRPLRGVDLTVDGPGATVIMGANGAGKSLLLRLVHGLLAPRAGDISWGGAPLTEARRRRQSLVFQKPVLLRRSVAANIDFVIDARGAQRRRRREQLLEQAGLAHKAGQPARLLSGGEQQKLALARALATGPEVLLLDEPCASIDAASTWQIETLLTETRARGVKLILVTHDVGQARRLADDVVFLHHGRVLEHQAAARFFAAPASPEARAYLEGKLIP